MICAPSEKNALVFREGGREGGCGCVCHCLDGAVCFVCVNVHVCLHPEDFLLAIGSQNDVNHNKIIIRTCLSKAKVKFEFKSLLSI